MKSIRIRPAADSDDIRIRDLARRCPQRGMITFFPNRTPRFNSLHRLLDPETWHLVAEDGDRMVGLVGVIHFNVRVPGGVKRMGYVMDLRVDEDYRRGTTAFRLVKTAVDTLLGSGVNTVMVNFLKDNPHPLVFTSGRAGIPPSEYIGDNRIYNIIPLRFLSTDERFSIGQADEHDIPDIVKLYESYAGRFRIAPDLTDAAFRRLIGTVEGLSLDRFLVARESGRIRAVTALWDEHTYRSVQVHNCNPKLRR